MYSGKNGSTESEKIPKTQTLLIGGSHRYLIVLKRVFLPKFEEFSPCKVKYIILCEVILSPRKLKLLLMSHQSDSSLLDIYSYLSHAASLTNGIVIIWEI